MDMKCATCQEPWEHHHLLQDLPFEIWDGEEGSDSHKVVLGFRAGDKCQIPPQMREGLAEEGWEFGRTIVAVLKCCCCGDNLGSDIPDKDEVETRRTLRLEAEEVLGDDLDGLISTLSSVDMYARME